ncbi:MAG: cytidine kinase [Patescibacteria group bacterium]|nr:cytidine kinase [Patescibacteria group bacterium]
MATSRALDAVAIGTCYVDTNVENFPFSSRGIAAEELIGKRYEVVPGGSAVNFCRLGHELGLRTAFIGMAGNDVNGDTLKNLLEQQGVQSDLIRQPGLQTNIGFNITNPQGEHIMFVAGTANAALDPAVVIPKLKEVLPETEILYLGGCFKLKAFKDAFGEIANLAGRFSAKVAIDHGRIPEGVSEGMLEAVKALVLRSAYYFPSREEFCRLWSVSNISEGMRRLQEQVPQLVVVVKDGANGAYYWTDNSIRHVEVEKVDEVVNATGAGDSFNAGVITALMRGRSLGDAITYGCEVAAAKIKAKELPLLPIAT